MNILADALSIVTLAAGNVSAADFPGVERSTAQRDRAGVAGIQDDLES